MQTEANSPEPDSSLPVNERHNGNVARLPKAVHDKVNRMIQDGYTYTATIEILGDAGKGLIPSNLSRWKERGYQDWLLQQTWLTQTRLRQEPAVDLSSDFDATQLNHAALQLGTLHMFEALRDLNTTTTFPPGGNDAAPPGEPQAQRR